MQLYSMPHKDTSPASWSKTVYVTFGGSRSNTNQMARDKWSAHQLTKKPWTDEDGVLMLNSVDTHDIVEMVKTDECQTCIPECTR